MDKLAKYALAPLVLRLGLAVVFIYHAMPKVTPITKWGIGWGDQMEMAPALQAAVAWGELLGGVALGIGFLTRLAALGMIGIMVGAIMTVHGKNGFAMLQMDESGKPLIRDGFPVIGYEFNAVLIVMLTAVFLVGSGVLGLDFWLFRRKPAPTPTPPAR